MAEIKQLVRSDAREHLLSFALLVHGDYRAYWHHNLIASYLDRVATGEIKRLIITAPPRHGKSQLVTRSFPAWYLGRYPDREVKIVSYNQRLANRFCRDFRRVVDSLEYSEIFPNVRLPTPKDRGWVNQADTVEIVDHGGSLCSIGLNGTLTGTGIDLGIIDDPIKNPEEAYSPTYRERAWSCYSQVLRTRLQGDHAALVIVMTRWHQDDMVGRLLRLADEDEYSEQWHVLELPAIKEGPPTDEDPREEGEPLWPERYDKKFLAEQRATGEKAWNALYMCRPSSAAGEIVHRGWIRPYGDAPICDMVIQTWDLNFGKDAKTVNSSYVSGQTWGRCGSNYFLLDAERGKWTHTENKKRVIAMRKRWPDCRAVYVEDAASGAPLISDLKGVVPGLVPVPPKGSKIARFEAVAPLFESGQVFVPDLGERWVREWIEEIVSFPTSPNNDQVDACAMALTKLTKVYDFGSFRGITGGYKSPMGLT